MLGGKEEKKSPKIFNTMLHVKNAAEIENYEIKERKKRKVIFPLVDIKIFDIYEEQPMFV